VGHQNLPNKSLLLNGIPKTQTLVASTSTSNEVTQHTLSLDNSNNANISLTRSSTKKTQKNG
jgi:hypothetical protein